MHNRYISANLYIVYVLTHRHNHTTHRNQPSAPEPVVEDEEKRLQQNSQSLLSTTRMRIDLLSVSG